eukprot:2668773-Amphidinium_carterae.1
MHSVWLPTPTLICTWPHCLFGLPSFAPKGIQNQYLYAAPSLQTTEISRKDDVLYRLPTIDRYLAAAQATTIRLFG